VIATVCDEGDFLFRVTQPAIRSFARHMPTHSFCLVLINGTGRHEEEIRSWHPRLILRNLPLEIRPEHLRGYQFCYMTLPLNDLLREFDEPLVYVDADTLLRGDLSPVFDMLSAYDLVVRCLPFQQLPGPTTQVDGARVNNGCLGLANNERTRRYTAELRDRVIAYLNGGGDPALVVEKTGTVTGLDQELLWVIYREMRDAIRLFPLDDRFNDSQMQAHSVLWHAKGTARRNPRYLYEAARVCRRRADMIRLWPKKLAMDIFRGLRTWQWRRNLRSFFRIPKIGRIVAGAPRRRLLVINSGFLRFNPELCQFDSIDCVDVDPCWYYENRKALAGVRGLRHCYAAPDAPLPVGEFDLVIADRALDDARAPRSVVRTIADAEALKWRRARLLKSLDISERNLVGAAPGVEPDRAV